MGSPTRLSLSIRRPFNNNKRNRRKKDGSSPPSSEPCESSAGISNADGSGTSTNAPLASNTVTGPAGLSSSCPLPSSRGRRNSRLSSLIARISSPKSASAPTTPTVARSLPGGIPQRCLADDLDNDNDSSHYRRSTKKSIMGGTPFSSSTKSTQSSFKFLRRITSPVALQIFHSDRDSGGSKETEESNAGSNSDDDKPHQQSVMDRTTVLPNLHSPELSASQQQPPPPPPSPHSSPVRREGPGKLEDALVPRFECATAILQHSYFERICGVRSTSFENDEQFQANLGLVDDPTVQESIECVFASQLEDGLDLWDDDEGDDYRHNSSVMSRTDLMRVDEYSERSKEDLVSPAELQQSRMNRNDRKDSVSFTMTETRKRYEQASLVYVGTYDPTIEDDEFAKIQHGGSTPDDPMPCPCTCNKLPQMDPKDWPQAPLLLRPTPGSGTRVKAVRYSNSKKDPLWVPGSHLIWSDRLAKNWGKLSEEQPHYPCCERCVNLPINNGNEEPGHSLVIDFESDLFEGTLLLRMRFSEGTTPDPYNDDKGYFKGMNRRYQACVRGRFKKAMPFTEMVTGFRFDRRCGKLPAKWILRGGLKVLSFFAPQLDAKLEGDRPHSLTPLGSTPQCIAVDNNDEGLYSLEGVHEEPVEADRTLFGESYAAPTSLLRAKMRKKVFDKLFVQRSQNPMTDPSKVYTFEFLQHLFNFQDFSIELGSMLGSVHLKDVLDGQPLQIMAAHGEQSLWSFDIWHECLWEEAVKHHREGDTTTRDRDDEALCGDE